MSRRAGIVGLARSLPLLLPVLLLSTLLALQHPRVVYTSDSVAQQSIIRTWFDVGHGTTFVPRDTWALKVPLYLVLENLPLLPLDRMLAAVLVLNALTFLMLGWATRRLAGLGTPEVRWYEVVAPLAWLAALGGGVGSNRLLANYRNVELGLCFVMLAMAAGYLANDREQAAGRAAGRRGQSAAAEPIRVQRRTLLLGAGSTLLLGALWFDDPYVELLVAAPLAVTALGWFLVRERDRRLLHLAAVLVASFAVTAALQVGVGRFGIEFADSGHTLALGADDLAHHLRLLWPGTELLLGVEQWDRSVPQVITQALVISVLGVMMAASVALAVHGWRQERLVLAFLGAHWPLVIGGFLVSWHTQDLGAGRYLVLAVCDLAVATAVLLPRLRRHRPGWAAGLVGLIALGAVLSTGTGTATAIDALRQPSATLPHQQAVVRAVERAVDEQGAVKGYAPFWAANITSYLVGNGTTVAEVVCLEGRLDTRQWLSDSVRLTRPAQKVFLIWDPQAPSLAGCPAAVRDAQLGVPVATYPITPSTQPTPGAGINAVLVYSPDIQEHLLPVSGE